MSIFVTVKPLAGCKPLVLLTQSRGGHVSVDNPPGGRGCKWASAKCSFIKTLLSTGSSRATVSCCIWLAITWCKRTASKHCHRQKHCLCAFLRGQRKRACGETELTLHCSTYSSAS